MGTISNKMGGVGVGVSVSVNNINGKTNAKVSGGSVSAQGKDANDKVKLNNQIDDSDINSKYVDSSTIDIKGSLAPSGSRCRERRLPSGGTGAAAPRRGRA